METLLQKAQKQINQRKARFTLSKEHEDVSLAWMRGEVTTIQVAKAMGRSSRQQSGNMLYMFAQALKSAYNNGRLVIKK